MSKAWKEGCEAAWAWYGTEQPKNPYPPNSQEALDWAAGFEQGADDYYEAWKRGET